VELGNISSAAGEFKAARSLDGSLFEAHMNYAAINMQFRGFSQAREAYEAAVKLRPGDYDARLGLALAMRAQIEAPDAAKVAEAARELERAKQIAPERPEAYFNEAVLTQEYLPPPESDPYASLVKAKALFSKFVEKAERANLGREDIERAKQRIVDIDTIIDFGKKGAEEKRLAEEERKQREAEEAAKEKE
jgi:tetratricopeptide (TPR) repeat protein